MGTLPHDAGGRYDMLWWSTPATRSTVGYRHSLPPADPALLRDPDRIAGALHRFLTHACFCSDGSEMDLGHHQRGAALMQVREGIGYELVVTPEDLAFFFRHIMAPPPSPRHLTPARWMNLLEAPPGPRRWVEIVGLEKDTAFNGKT